MRLLASAVGAAITDAFIVGDERADVEGLVSEEGPELATEDLVELLVEGMARFADDPIRSDQWVGPRLHAVLRISRREAARQQMWLHLAIVDCPEYVWWRWQPTGRRARFLGGADRQALSRLWWATELFRVGADYGPAATALDLQEIPNTLLRIGAVRNQPFCAALLEFLATRRSDGQRFTGRQINRLSTAINSQLFVALLDAVAPSAGLDGERRRVWRENPVPIEDLISQDPAGPDDSMDPDFATKAHAALALLHRVADSAGIATNENPRAGSKRPGDIVPDEEPELEDDTITGEL